MEREIENWIELVPQVGWDAAACCEFVHEYSVIIFLYLLQYSLLFKVRAVNWTDFYLHMVTC
jgi:hypothetical protein